MATAGSGDVLSGMIGALLGQGYTPSMAAQVAVYTHGLAGDLAATALEERSLMAGDLIETLPRAFQQLTQSRERCRRAGNIPGSRAGRELLALKEA